MLVLLVISKGSVCRYALAILLVMSGISSASFRLALERARFAEGSGCSVSAGPVSISLATALLRLAVRKDKKSLRLSAIVTGASR